MPCITGISQSTKSLGMTACSLVEMDAMLAPAEEKSKLGMGDRDLTRSLSDMAEWRSAARMGSMMTLPFIEVPAMVRGGSSSSSSSSSSSKIATARPIASCLRTRPAWPVIPVRALDSSSSTLQVRAWVGGRVVGSMTANPKPSFVPPCHLLFLFLKAQRALLPTLPAPCTVACPSQDDLREARGKNELRAIAGLSSMMPATRNRFRGEPDLVPPPVARKAMESSLRLRSGAALEQEEQLEREFAEQVRWPRHGSANATNEIVTHCCSCSSMVSGCLVGQVSMLERSTGKRFNQPRATSKTNPKHVNIREMRKLPKLRTIM